MQPSSNIPKLIILAMMVTGLHLWSQSQSPCPPEALIGGDRYEVITADPDNKPKFLDDAEFTNALDVNPGKGHWHIVEPTAKFDSDQPQFKMLMADPNRTDSTPNWVTIGTANKITKSKQLPATAAATEALVK